MTLPTLGVVVVSFNSSDVILDCLESLLSSTGVILNVVVVDNFSTDGTPNLLNAWATGETPYTLPEDSPVSFDIAEKPLSLNGEKNASSPHKITLLDAGVNGGFAAGVNMGLAKLAENPSVSRFWVLNPDTMVPATTAAAFATCPEEETGFSLMGGRVLYLDNPDKIQIDGGTINRKTGVTGNLNIGQSHAQTPSPSTQEMDFITGASMVASRQFYEAVGPMHEDYFLYYEEVDWALRKGALPFAYCPGGIVYHRAGTSIGSPTLWRPASPFSLYFKHRNRIRLTIRHFPLSLPGAMAFSVGKSLQLLLKKYPVEAFTILSSSLGLKPSKKIRSILTEEAQILAFGKNGK